MLKSFLFPTAVGVVALLLFEAPAEAHGPLFSPAPETIFKGGTELTFGFHTEKATGTSEHETEYQGTVEAEYGITANWEAGVELPYTKRQLDNSGATADGIGDIALRTKYQFWGLNLSGAQYKASGFLKVKLPTGDDDSTPRLGTGSTDVITGLATGYESRRWYWFASGVYRANTEGAGGLRKGDRQFLNVVGGIRPILSAYDKPDTVLMLELNWERSARDDLNGTSLANTGGWEMFLSPVAWWTYRQLAIRGGVQLPIAHDLNGTQPTSDYRARLEFVYHF